MTSLTFADSLVRQQSRLVSRLAFDLDRIRLGIGPTAQELEQAPLIDGWFLGVRTEQALVGEISDHPGFSGFGVTSGLYVLDPEQKYARTLSRWYRLGQELS